LDNSRQMESDKEDMKPQYKVVRFIDIKTNEEFFALAKVVFDENGKPEGCHEPILDADTIEDLIAEYEEMAEAFKVQPMHEKDFFHVH
jgi:hypothetical protein